MKLTQKILKYLIENKDKEFTIREMSKLMKTDYKNTYDAVKMLGDSIILTKKASSHYIKFKAILTTEIYEVEIERKKQVKLKLIKDDIEKIKNPLFCAILFGSYAKNTQTKNSDIDICIIYTDEESYKEIYSALSIHPNIEIHGFRVDEFISMLRDKSFNVGHEIYKHGIILHNIESYYRLIKYE